MNARARTATARRLATHRGTHAATARARTATRRGVMLFAVLVVLAVAALAVGALSVAQEAEYAGQVAAQDRTQQRAMAWSGAQAVAAALAEQRQQIALGEEPVLPAELVLWEDEGQLCVVRPLPVGPQGELAVGEASKRALAAVSAAELEQTGVVASATAAAVTARSHDAADLEALVDPAAGLPPTLVLGPVVSSIADGVRAAQQGDTVPDGVARPLALADVLTPFEAQRALGVAGLGDLAPRIPLGAEWTDEASQALEQACTPAGAQRVRQALEDKVPATETELVQALIKAKVEPKEWSAVLAAVVCGPEAIEVDRVDLGRAPEAVLRTVPGISAEKAARLVQERASLDPAERTQLAWPVVHNVLTPEEFAAAAPHLTSHSWLWRMRLVTGTVQADEGGSSVGSSVGSPLEGVQVWDVVVDLSEDPPRFASLRDSTLLPVAAALAQQLGRAADVDQESGAGARGSGLRDNNADAEDSRGIGMPSTAFGPPLRPASQPATSPDDSGRSAEPAEPAPPARWEYLGEQIRKEREARDRAERERRASDWAWTKTPPKPQSTPPRAGDAAPSPSAESSGTPPADASTSPGGGMRTSDAPPASTPTGSLSGRWRAHGSRP